MARVLSDGPVGEMTTICNRCHYKVGYVAKEVTHTEDEYSWDKGAYIWCPNCKKTTSVPRLDTVSPWDPSDLDL
jgi:C4-type Zn-finger protein